MNTGLFHQFQSYMDIADNFKQITGLYFLIKNYAINKITFFVSKDQNILNPNEKTFLNNTIDKFRTEVKNTVNANAFTKEEYSNFLEQYFDKVDFNQVGYRQLEICKDLCEVMCEFGNLEELWVKRSKYFFYCIFNPHIFDFFR